MQRDLKYIQRERKKFAHLKMFLHGFIVFIAKYELFSIFLIFLYYATYCYIIKILLQLQVLICEMLW